MVRCDCDFKSVNSKHNLGIDILTIEIYIYTLEWMAEDLVDGKFNFGWGNGLVPSGNKALPGPKLAPIYVAIRWHYTNMS